jgi:hypothetical protein
VAGWRAAVSLWWPLAAPPALWALQGASIWGLATLACPPGGGAGAISAAAARAGVLVATVLGLAGSGTALLATRRRLRAAAGDAAENTRFLVWAGGFVAAAFTLGLLYGALPGTLVGVCETMR